MNLLKNKTITISVRLSSSQANEIENLARKKGVDRSTIIRELISIGLKEMKINEILNLIRERKITVWKAAQITNLTYREMLELLKKHNVPYPLSSEELLKEIEEIESSK